jgi:hypothetical protein
MSERTDAEEIVSSALTRARVDSDAYPNCTELNGGVRQPFATLAGHQDCQRRSKRPAHPSNRLVAQLNERWRVVDDPLQWILQRRKGNPRARNSGWRDRSFCRMKYALMGCISKHCGEIDAGARSTVEALPECHPDSERNIHSPNLDVRRTSRAQAKAQVESLASEALEACED